MRSVMSLLLGVSYVFWSVAMVVDQPAVGASDLGASVAAATLGGCGGPSPCKEKTESRACSSCYAFGNKWNKCGGIYKGFDCTWTTQPNYTCTLSGEMTCTNTGYQYDNENCSGIGAKITPCKMKVASGTTCP